MNDGLRRYSWVRTTVAGVMREALRRMLLRLRVEYEER